MARRPSGHTRSKRDPGSTRAGSAALRRNRVREGRERVPDVAIFAVRKRLEPPSVAEGFDRLFTVLLIEEERRFEVTPYAG